MKFLIELFCFVVGEVLGVVFVGIVAFYLLRYEDAIDSVLVRFYDAAKRVKK